VSDNHVTNALDVAIPYEIVVLNDLKTVAGEAVRVRCEKPDPLCVVRQARSLPGVATKREEMSEQQALEFNVRWAPMLVEAGTSLAGPDGDEVRPAFYFGDARPNPRSIHGRALSARDLVALAEAVARLHVGEEAEALSFPDGDGGGRGDGPGVVEAGGGVGQDAVGGAA